jgi:hypothetical protein
MIPISQDFCGIYKWKITMSNNFLELKEKNSKHKKCKKCHRHHCKCDELNLNINLFLNNNNKYINFPCPVCPTPASPFALQQVLTSINPIVIGGQQGFSVSLSSSGLILAVGAPAGSDGAGAVLIYTSLSPLWNNGATLVPVTIPNPHGTSPDAFGSAVALNSAGNILVVGAPNFVSFVGPPVTITGGAYLFTRIGAGWSDGLFLTQPSGSGSFTNSLFGSAVAINTLGSTSTIVVGSPNFNGGVGEAWIYTFGSSGFAFVRSVLNAVSPLFAPVGLAQFGASISITNLPTSIELVIGGPNNITNSITNAGATWVFTFTPPSTLTFTQQLFGAGAITPANQGTAVAVSPNNVGGVSTIAIGGPGDNNDVGASWIFQGPAGLGGGYSLTQKIVGNNTSPPGPPPSTPAAQGISIALTPTASILAVGADFYNLGPRGPLGAAFAFGAQGPGFLQIGSNPLSDPSLTFQGISVALATNINSITNVTTNILAVGAIELNTGATGAVLIYTQLTG